MANTMFVGRYKANQWIINEAFSMGDDTGLTLSITGLGQVQYTSTNITDSVNTLTYKLTRL